MNTFATPVFPSDLPEISQLDKLTEQRRTAPMTRPDQTYALDSFATAGTLDVGTRTYQVQRLDGLAIDALPYSLRVVLENLLRHEDGAPHHRRPGPALLDWGEAQDHTQEHRPESVTDLPARHQRGPDARSTSPRCGDAMAELGEDPALVNPLIPAELVIDHSVIADVFGRSDAFARNVDIEYSRNSERYRFLQLGPADARGLRRRPSGHGDHAPGQHRVPRPRGDGRRRAGRSRTSAWAPTRTPRWSTVSGSSAWGIGGIEAEAVMLGESLSMLLPRVLGFRLHGELPEGATATDLVLTITEMLRPHGVVGKFVEFYGPGVSATTLADRVTISNMSPEFGSTCAYFPIDEETLRYLRFTGRPEATVRPGRGLRQGPGAVARPGPPARYSELVELDLGTVVPSLAGPTPAAGPGAARRCPAAFRAVLPEILGHRAGRRRRS